MEGKSPSLLGRLEQQWLATTPGQQQVQARVVDLQAVDPQVVDHLVVDPRVVDPQEVDPQEVGSLVAGLRAEDLRAVCHCGVMGLMRSLAVTR